MMHNNILSNYQHGFVRGRSCTTQMLLVVDKLSEILDQGGAVDTVYLDFAKAFDSVPHERLLLKLQSYGVSGCVLNWIRNFITLRQQSVCVDGIYSALVNVISGVPQGSVLGPALFVCYINDMPESVASLLFMYADDSKVVRQIQCESDYLALQSDLDKLCDWSKDWQLRFNLDKCKILCIGKCNVKRQYSMQDKNDQTTILFDTGRKESWYLDG